MKMEYPVMRTYFDENEIRYLRECLDSGWVTQGPFVKRFEALFAERHGVSHALAATSCTAALHMAVLALDIGPGDEVIVPAFTWVTSAHCAEYAGAKVVFADIDIDTYNIDPLEIEKRITPRTKAIVAVHLFGLSAPMDEILAIAEQHNLRVIEDAACAVGSFYQGKNVGSLGDIGCFSFHPRKVITTGEGGMVTTVHDDLAKKVQRLRNHGATGPRSDIPVDKAYHMGTFNELGYNLRMSDIQAAVGVAQMAKLDMLLDERKRLADQYSELLSDSVNLVLPKVGKGCGHTYQSFVVRIADGDGEHRNRIMDILTDKGIQTRPGTHAVHRLGYYVEKYNLDPEMYPKACTAEDTTITLPMFHDMTLENQSFIVDVLKKA